MLCHDCVLTSGVWHRSVLAPRSDNDHPSSADARSAFGASACPYKKRNPFGVDSTLISLQIPRSLLPLRQQRMQGCI
jgi:hypothetical protein